MTKLTHNSAQTNQNGNEEMDTQSQTQLEEEAKILKAIALDHSRPLDAGKVSTHPEGTVINQPHLRPDEGTGTSL